LQGHLLCEVAELDSFSKAEMSTIKMELTNTSDNFRPLFGKSSKDHPRRCVFVGTTNQEGYLDDVTGNRRFWPIECGEIDLDKLAEDREQLFAEAAVRLSQYNNWWDMPESATRAQQNSRQDIDLWSSPVAEYLALPNSRFSGVDALEILTNSKIKKDVDKIKQEDKKRINKILRSMGWKSTPTSRHGVSIRVFRPGPDAAPPDMPNRIEPPTQSTIRNYADDIPH